MKKKHLNSNYVNYMLKKILKMGKDENDEEEFFQLQQKENNIEYKKQKKDEKNEKISSHFWFIIIFQLNSIL